jgi:hypothetical protein
MNCGQRMFVKSKLMLSGDGGVVQVVECLPSKHKTLHSIPSTAINK